MLTIHLTSEERETLLDFVEGQLEMSQDLYTPEDPDPMEPIYLKLLEQLS